MKRYLILCFALILFSSYAVAQEQTYIKHKVRWMETLYSIARKYKVDAVDIAIVNDLKRGQVQKGQILLIPQTPVDITTYTEEPTTDSVQIEETPSPEQPEITDYGCSQYEPSLAQTPVVSVVLPITGNRGSDGFVEFYQGVLVAAKQMQEKGMNARIQCFDWNAYSPADELLSSPQLAQSNVIIGPIYSAEVGSALAYFDNTDVKIVSPLDANASVWLSGRPNLFQVPAPASAQHQAIANALDPHNATIWVISETGETEVAPEIRAVLDKNLIPYRNFSYDVLDGRKVTTTLQDMFDSEKRNQIIIASQNEAFVSDAMRNLHLLFAYHQIPIELFGLSRWRNFETLDLAALHQLQVVLPLSVYVDYTQEQVKDFVRTFRSLYSAEPTNYAFQGYDVAFYFLNALFRFGPRFEGCIDQLDGSLLQSNYVFTRENLDDGFCNNSVRLIRYLPDYTVTLLPKNR